jgi:4'-phosphopantetheinyl transferase
MVVAIGSNNFMGVDIEAWNNQIDHLAVANQCFADTEKTTWLTLSEDEKSAMFYQLWTRKESFAKATGSGITLDVSKVITTFENGISRFASIPSCFGNVLEWKLVDLDFGDGLSGALTVKTNEFSQLNFQSLSIYA